MRRLQIVLVALAVAAVSAADSPSVTTPADISLEAVAVVSAARAPSVPASADIPPCAKCYDYLVENAAQDSGALYVRVAGGGCTSGDPLELGVRCIDCDEWDLDSYECFQGDNEWWIPANYPNDFILLPAAQLIQEADGFTCADNPCGYEPEEFVSALAELEAAVGRSDGKALAEVLREGNGLFYVDVQRGAIQSFGCSNAVVLHIPLPMMLQKELNTVDDIPKLNES